MKVFEQIGKQYISSAVKKSKYGWPPVCVGIIYQPERPVSNTRTKCVEVKHLSFNKRTRD